MAFLLNNANVVVGDDIDRIDATVVEQRTTNILLPQQPDDVVTEYPGASGFDNEDMTNVAAMFRPAYTDPASGYLLYFSYLPSSYSTPDYPNFTLLATPGVKIGEISTGSSESWGLVGE